MLHEPKFQILAGVLLAVFTGGFAMACQKKTRRGGMAIMAVSGFILVLMFVYWPESSTTSPSISTETQGGGTGGVKAGGGGGGKGAPGGSGGTYIEKQYNYGLSTPVPTIPARPDVTLRFIYPTEPALQLVNQSGVTARDIKWMVVLWNLDMPDHTNPLPIRAQNFDFIMPHSPGGPEGLFDAPMAASLVRTGDHLIGSASVSCPDCARGHTFVVYITLGKGGWFTEVLDKTSGEVLTPRHLTRLEIAKYAQTLLSLVPQSARTPIGEP
jgi:hypothetical protein